MNYQKFYTNQIHSSSLLCQLAQMWKTQVLCDAMIKTGSVTTKAHRVVLVAACPMLQSMDNATSGSHLEVRLAAEIKQDSINTFLQYLYEGFMMLTEDNVRDVEKIARLLQVDSIIKCCADFHKCLQAKTGAPSPQYKYGFHDMIEFRHVRSSDLQKTVHERMMKRPSEMSRPGSPGSKRHRSNRPSSPPTDASSLGASGEISQSGPDPWDRVPQLGSGMSSHSSSWPSTPGRSKSEPGVIEIIEDSLELVQTVGPDKDSGPGGTRLDPRAVQKSVAISVASQMNTDTDLRIVDVPSDTDTRTTYQTSTVPSAQAQGPSSSQTSRSFTHSSPAPLSKESKFSEKSYSGMSRDESKKRPDIPLQSFSSDNLHARAIQQHRASNESHSTSQKMPFPVSISPIGSGKSFAAGSAEQVSSASDLPSVRSPVASYRPQASPASHHSPMTPPSMSPSSVKSQSASIRRPSDMSRLDLMDDSSSEKGQDHRKDSNIPQSSTADMTPDLSIVKVETKHGTSYAANTETGGLDMYVDMPEHEQPDDDEGNIDYEEPSGDWSQEDDCSNISGDQSSSWYSGTYQEKGKKAYSYPERAGLPVPQDGNRLVEAVRNRVVSIIEDKYCQPLVTMDTTSSVADDINDHHGLSSNEFDNSNSYVEMETMSDQFSESHRSTVTGEGRPQQSQSYWGRPAGMQYSNELKCSVCYKTFANKGNLRTHVRLHTGENPYKCEFCNRAYPQKIQLKLHMKKHQMQNV